MRALLLTKGLEPKTHEGALSLFGSHFVKQGIFKPSDSHTFARLMKYREEADYNPAYIFTSDDYREFQKDVTGLVRKILDHLNARGYGKNE